MIILDFRCYIFTYLFFNHSYNFNCNHVYISVFDYNNSFIHLSIHNTIIVLITSDVSRSPLSLVLDLSGVLASSNILKSS